MKNKILLTAFILAATLSTSAASIFAAPATKSLGFQGQLYSNNAPVSESVNATFRFYDALSGGNTTGSLISKVITVNNGFLDTQFSESDLAAVDFNKSLYIEVTINGTPLSPRTALNSSPSSIKTFGAYSFASAPTAGPSGSLYFNSITSQMFVSDGTNWLSFGTTSPWAMNGTSTYYAGGNVGIGTTTPAHTLTVEGDTLTTGTSYISSLQGIRSNEPDFTIALFPDTQNAVNGHNEIWVSMADWIVNNKDSHNIQAAISVGDVTDNGTTTEFQNAVVGWDIIKNAGMKYVPIVGNHDYDNGTLDPTRATALWNQYFGTGYFAGKDWFGGTYDGGTENYYMKFDVGNRKYMIIAFELFARDEVLAWAQGIVDANPDREVIVTTHSYLNNTGARTSATDSAGSLSYGFSATSTTLANDSQAVWNKFIKVNSNIFLVLSGHQICKPYTAYSKDVNNAGKVVNQLFMDYQCASNTGEGYIGLIKFQPSQGKISVSSYSPYLDTFDPAVNYTMNYENFNINSAIESTRSILTSQDMFALGNVATNGLFTGGGTAGLKVLSNGSVGIGTTTTNAKLHVSSEENGDAIFILSADTGNKSEENNPWMEFTQDGGLVSSQFGFTGNIAGNAFARQISGGMTNAMILNTTGTSPIQFSASSTVALTIDGTTRKIGIGTTTPSTLLHLASSDSNNTAFRIDNTSSGASWGIWVTGTSSSIGESKFNIYDYKNAASRLSINTSGQVGIGSTEPVHALDVYGDCIAFMGSCIGANSPTNIVEYVGTVFQYGEDGAIANALTRFMPTLGGTIATSDILSNVVTRNGILRNFYVQADANSLNGPTTFEVFKNGAASGFTVVLGANQTAASATNNSLIVSAGDRISLRVVTTGTGTLTRPSASFEHMMSTNVFSASQWITSTTTPSNIFFETGNVGIGTQSPLYKLDVRGNFGAGSANLTSFFVDGTSGKIGIGTTTPTAFLTASGTVRFSTLVGNGANLVVDTLGNVTVSSDERLKDIQGMFEKGLEQIKLLNPILFKWKPETGYEASSTYAGFSAQNVQSAIPEAVATDTQGFLTLADRPILAALVNAVKELAGKIEGFAEVVKTKDMETNRMCMKKQDGNTVCVTAEQLERVLGGQGIVNTTQSQAVSPVSVEATSTISEDEIIDAVPPPQDSLVLPASEEDK